MERRLAMDKLPQRYSLVLLDTPATDEIYSKLRQNAEFAVAGDGAANRLKKLLEASSNLLPPTHITGDLDSVHSETLLFFRSVPIEPRLSQDFNDFEKCLDCLMGLQWRGEVLAVAGMHGRVDHTLANFSVLFENKYREMEITLIDDRNVSRAVFPGYTEIEVSPQWTNCGLIPMEPSVVTTTGLKWNLTGQVLAMGGLVSSSNKTLERVVTIQTSGNLLWTASAG